MVGQFKGTLVGYRSYDKAVTNDDGTTRSEKRHIYNVFCVGVKRDPQTKLFMDECKIVTVVEEAQVLKTLEYGAHVTFYGETAKDKKGNDYMRFSGIDSDAN